MDTELAPGCVSDEDWLGRRKRFEDISHLCGASHGPPKLQNGHYVIRRAMRRKSPRRCYSYEDIMIDDSCGQVQVSD